MLVTFSFLSRTITTWAIINCKNNFIRGCGCDGGATFAVTRTRWIHRSKPEGLELQGKFGWSSRIWNDFDIWSSKDQRSYVNEISSGNVDVGARETPLNSGDVPDSGETFFDPLQIKGKVLWWKKQPMCTSSNLPDCTFDQDSWSLKSQ